MRLHACLRVPACVRMCVFVAVHACVCWCVCLNLFCLFHAVGSGDSDEFKSPFKPMPANGAGMCKMPGNGSGGVSMVARTTTLPPPRALAKSGGSSSFKRSASRAVDTVCCRYCMCLRWVAWL